MFGLPKIFLVIVILPIFMVFLVGAALGASFARR